MQLTSHRKDRHMMRRPLLTATVVAVALVVPLAGCAGKFKMTAKQMCEAHG